jgi:hypothetical protein
MIRNSWSWDVQRPDPSSKLGSCSRAHLWGNLIQTLDALWTRTEFRSMVVGL